LFLERLEIEDVEEREWITMGIINLCAVLEDDKPAGIIRAPSFLNSYYSN